MDNEKLLTKEQIQPNKINQVLTNKFNEKEIIDDFGFTGEYRLSQKDILDIIIELNIVE